MESKFVACFLALVLAPVFGCGDDHCDVDNNSGCDEGFVCRDVAGGDPGCFCNPVSDTGCEDASLACEEVEGGTPGCFAPLAVRGFVFDISTPQNGIEGARVVALDANGSVVSSVAVTDADGNYELGIPALRDADGYPVSAQISLRADAAGYQTFPSGVRLAQPIDIGSPVDLDGLLVVESAQTEVGLIPLPAGSGSGSIYGNVEIPDAYAGVLVVAETSSGTVGYSALADRDGGYRIFNLPEASYSVIAYAQGVNYDEVVPVDIGAGGEQEVDLSINDEAAATLNGKVDIVNPGSGNGTSVILVVESTFNENLVRGESPPGMRAPTPGIEPNISGAFTIEGVPAGRYVVLAAFENDFLVRDPDTCIAGTEILHQEVFFGDVLDIDASFKVTGALDVLAPGADQPDPVSAPLTLTWVDDSSETGYQVTVLDTFGNIVWATSLGPFSGEDPTVEYGGPLDPGMYYQYRVLSERKNGECQISQSEDLKGVFYVP